MTESGDERVGGNEPYLRGSRGASANRAATREDQRRADALQAVRLSDLDVESLAIQASPLAAKEDLPMQWASEASPADVARWRYDKELERDRVLQAVKKSLLDREIDAYLKGFDNATDRDAKRAYNTRSIVLLLVVLAVVLMPIIAIVANLRPPRLWVLHSARHRHRRNCGRILVRRR
jgi:hypothetical protein